MNDRINARQQLVLLGLFFILLAAVRPTKYYETDLKNIAIWIAWIMEHGVQNAYAAPRAYYGPLAAYFFQVFGWFIGSGDQVAANIRMLQPILVLFDLATVFMVMRLLERYQTPWWRAFYILFNLAFLYNSFLWGQLDGYFTCLVLAALLLGLAGRPILSAVVVVLALNIKPQPIIFFPLVALAALQWFYDNPRKIWQPLAAMGLIQLLLLAPYLWNGQWTRVLNAYLANTAPSFLSINAFNIWYLLIRGNIKPIADTVPYFGISARMWGLVLFALFSLLVLVPIGLRSWRYAKTHAAIARNDAANYFLASGLVAIAFFFFDTHMHERYSYPAVLFLGVYAVLTGSYGIYILVSAAHLLNIIAVFPFVPLERVLPIALKPELVALLFAGTLGWGAWLLYRQISPRHEWSRIRARTIFP